MFSSEKQLTTYPVGTISPGQEYIVIQDEDGKNYWVRRDQIKRTFMTIKEYLASESQDKLRTQLMDYLKKNPMSFSVLALKIGVGRGTLVNFLHGKPAIYRTLGHIECYLKEQDGMDISKR